MKMFSIKKLANIHIKLGVIALALLLSFAAGAQAQEWYTANQHTVSWDAGEGAVSYRLYLKPVKGGDPVLIGEVQATQAAFTLPGVGRFYPCAQSVNGDDASEIVCADVAANCLGGNTFGLKLNPGNPRNLR